MMKENGNLENYWNLTLKVRKMGKHEIQTCERDRSIFGAL